MSSDKKIFEKIYEQGAVWTETEPPKELVELVESGKIKPCKVLDVGCGEGFYSIYLASKGFEVTGVDLAETAIKIANKNADKNGVTIKFMQMDSEEIDKIRNKFDFVLEWAVLHHIAPEQRKKHIENINGVLNKEGKYLSDCFSNQNPDFDAQGKSLRVVPKGAKIPAGTRMYYSSPEELRRLFEQKFHIIESKLIEMTAGKKSTLENISLWKQYKVNSQIKTFSSACRTVTLMRS